MKFDRQELIEFYIDTGMSHEDAVRRCESFVTTYSTMGRNDRNFWRDVREHEVLQSDRGNPNMIVRERTAPEVRERSENYIGSYYGYSGKRARGKSE